MSDVMPDEGLALRGAALKDVTQAIAAARGFERERRTRRLLGIGGGWAVAAMMSAVAAASLGVMWNRPVPQDRFYMAVLHDDGTYDAPVPREDLSRSRRDMLFRHTVIQYVRARENYSWEAVNANYRQVSAMSDPAERDRYQTVMLDKKNPENPAVIFGDGPGTGIADVTAIQVQTDPASPNAVAASFLLRVSLPNQPPRTIRKTARMTWMPAEDRIPADVQQTFDPMGIAFTHYSSTLDPDAPR